MEELGYLFRELFRRGNGGKKVHSAFCRAFADLLRAHARGEIFGDGEHAVRIRSLVFFRLFVLFPDGESFCIVTCAVAAEDVGMAENQLFDNAGYCVRAVEIAGLLLQNGMERRLQ